MKKLVGKRGVHRYQARNSGQLQRPCRTDLFGHVMLSYRYGKLNFQSNGARAI